MKYSDSVAMNTIAKKSWTNRYVRYIDHPLPSAPPAFTMRDDLASQTRVMRVSRAMRENWDCAWRRLIKVHFPKVHTARLRHRCVGVACARAPVVLKRTGWGLIIEKPEETDQTCTDSAPGTTVEACHLTLSACERENNGVAVHLRLKVGTIEPKLF